MKLSTDQPISVKLGDGEETEDVEVDNDEDITEEEEYYDEKTGEADKVPVEEEFQIEESEEASSLIQVHTSNVHPTRLDSGSGPIIYVLTLFAVITSIATTYLVKA